MGKTCLRPGTTALELSLPPPIRIQINKPGDAKERQTFVVHSEHILQHFDLGRDHDLILHSHWTFKQTTGEWTQMCGCLLDVMWHCEMNISEDAQRRKPASIPAAIAAARTSAATSSLKLT